jgi:hypothetical protein
LSEQREAELQSANVGDSEALGAELGIKGHPASGFR